MSDSFDALLDSAVARKSEAPDSVDAEITLAGKTVVLRYSPLEPRLWTGHALKAIPRDGVMIDSIFGFDVTAAALSATPDSAVRVVGDGTVEVTAEQWEKLLPALDADGLRQITNAVLAMNEFAAIERLDAAKKALEGELRQKRRSPAN